MAIPVRTLHFAPIIPSMTKEIRGYFTQFGEVDFLQFHLEDGNEYGFVQFIEAKYAEEVLSQERHCILNYSLRVSAADDHHQPDFKPENWMLPPQQDTPSHILIALNDDCLREVFLRLKSHVLSRAAEVCVRFNQIAKEAFAVNFKQLKLDSGTLECSLFSDSPLSPLESETKHILSNFGSSIHSLQVYDFMAVVSIHLLHEYGPMAGLLSRSQSLLRMIGQYCISNLTELELHHFSVDSSLPNEIYPIFAKLEKLTLHSCYFYDDTSLKSLLSTCNELNGMIVHNCQVRDWQCITRKFLKLEEIHLIVNNGFNIDYLSNFIILNPTITIMSLKDGDIEASEVCRIVGENLPNLLEFELDCMDSNEFQDNIRYLGGLRQLKVLKMNLQSKRIAPLMAALVRNNVPIRYLKLSNGKIDVEAIDHISQLKEITALELWKVDDLVDEHVIELAKQLPRMEEIALYQIPISLSTISLKKVISHAKNLSFLGLNETDLISAIDVDDYKAMLKSVQNRPKKLRLIMIYCSDVSRVNVSCQVLNENQQFICIQELLKEVTIEVTDFDEDYDDFHPYVDYDDFDDYNDEINWYWRDEM